jgi:hypothetical protein
LGILGASYWNTIRIQEEDFLLNDLFFDFERRGYLWHPIGIQSGSRRKTSYSNESISFLILREGWYT